jgi:adenosylcobyric acid synthase
MGFAEAVDCPVILIADIDKGGVFAHIIGTLELLSTTEQNRIVGFVINRFRGDMALLQPGIDWLEQKTGKPVFAVLPYLHDLYLEAEDAVAIDKYQHEKQDSFQIVIPLLPRISNHTDFDPLLLHPEVTVKFVKHPDDCKGADLIILPGSKSVRDDLHWLKKIGWGAFINKHLRYGGRIIGLCGGYQMLGNTIHDPKGVEGNPGSSSGLGLLDIETILNEEKCLRHVTGYLSLNNTPVSGYEIHMGKSQGQALNIPAMRLNGTSEGAFSEDKLIMGCYLHGLFDLPSASQALLSWAGCKSNRAVDIDEIREQGIELITLTLEEKFDFNLLKIILMSSSPKSVNS